MSETRSALADLAERLGRVIIPHPKTMIYNDLIKAYRIVAELAKVKDEGEYSPHGYKVACRDAYEDCREIAEEGADNGK